MRANAVDVLACIIRDAEGCPDIESAIRDSCKRHGLDGEYNAAVERVRMGAVEAAIEDTCEHLRSESPVTVLFILNKSGISGLRVRKIS